MTAAKPTAPKSDTTRNPWPAIPSTKDIGKGSTKTKRTLIPIEQLSLVDGPVPEGRISQGSRYNDLFDACLSQGKLIKTPPDTAASVASMLRHWLARKGVHGYSPRCMNVYDPKDRTGRVWLVKTGAPTPTKPLPKSGAARAGQRAKKGGAA